MQLRRCGPPSQRQRAIEGRRRGGHVFLRRMKQRQTLGEKPLDTGPCSAPDARPGRCVPTHPRSGTRHRRDGLCQAWVERDLSTVRGTFRESCSALGAARLARKGLEAKTVLTVQESRIDSERLLESTGQFHRVSYGLRVLRPERPIECRRREAVHLMQDFGTGPIVQHRGPEDVDIVIVRPTMGRAHQLAHGIPHLDLDPGVLQVAHASREPMPDALILNDDVEGQLPAPRTCARSGNR